MPQIKSHKELWGSEFPIGGEWDARATHPATRPEEAGRWSVKREPKRFVVVFHSSQTGQDKILAEYPPSEQGEIEAKLFALTTEQK
jgi:hypothetical protein